MGTDYYDPELARLFAEFAKDTRCIGEPFLREALPIAGRAGMRVLDVGCGSGRWLDLLTERYDSVTGIDPGREQIKLAAEDHPAVTLEVAGLMETTGSYDVVLSYNAVHYVDDPGALSHLRSLVAPGGTLVVVDVTQDPDAEGKWHTLEYQILDACRDTMESLTERSRNPAVAFDVMRLHSHPAWLAHCEADPPLTRPQFVERYGAAFPAAQFTALHRVHTAMVWQAPAA